MTTAKDLIQVCSEAAEGQTSVEGEGGLNFKKDWSGAWNRIHVVLSPEKLFFRSYYEGKGEGYNFEMVRKGDAFVVAKDETSYPVPGSSVLWLIANGHENWNNVEEPKQADIAIPVGKMQAAVESMAEEESLQKSDLADESVDEASPAGIVGKVLAEVLKAIDTNGYAVIGDDYFKYYFCKWSVRGKFLPGTHDYEFMDAASESGKFAEWASSGGELRRADTGAIRERIGDTMKEHGPEISFDDFMEELFDRGKLPEDFEYERRTGSGAVPAAKDLEKGRRLMLEKNES